MLYLYLYVLYLFYLFINVIWIVLCTIKHPFQLLQCRCFCFVKSQFILSNYFCHHKKKSKELTPAQKWSSIFKLFIRQDRKSTQIKADTHCSLTLCHFQFRRNKNSKKYAAVRMSSFFFLGEEDTLELRKSDGVRRGRAKREQQRSRKERSDGK